MYYTGMVIELDQLTFVFTGLADSDYQIRPQNPSPTSNIGLAGRVKFYHESLHPNKTKLEKGTVKMLYCSSSS